ncbi:alpha/beta hydrolase [Microbacterium sp. SORGH_AS_0862]|uniref:alpha/beta hydrolase n=1 Tax=Microbacterium sp. SORGH_AS_0862 TaxID=3041789 RepID=UPI0027939A0A|nr:alpha/beta fold hydrolase [Microbacterium sp. SORGH_AS_0862]MDQ1206264.1 pimeloyl-ACP methyl ester carboxylesterase [Microbacterium sp. SORGH_AS_0862]
MYEDVTFNLPTTTLRGRLYLPPTDEEPSPVVIAHSGIGSVAEGIYDLAPTFTESGSAVLFYDHRGFGYSDGLPRQEVDPLQFARDLRDVITLLSDHPRIDAGRISLLGLSLGGLVSLLVAGTDHRIASVVAIVPPISGFSARGLFPADALRQLDEDLARDRSAQLHGAEPRMLQTSGVRVPGGPDVMFDDPEGWAFVQRYMDLPSFRNELTLSSAGRVFEAEVGGYAPRIVAPVLMVLASNDTVAPVADARAFFDDLRGEKELWEYPGQHYGILLDNYRAIISRSMSWIAGRRHPVPAVAV